MTFTFWRCSVCGFQSHSKGRPSDHWRPRLDGQSRICRGPFEKYEARKIA